MGDRSDVIDYQALFCSTPTPLVVLDPALKIVDANDAHLATVMRTRQDLVGKPFDEAFPDNPDDPAANGVAALAASLRRVLRERVTDVMAIQKYDIPQPGGGFATRYWAPVNAPVLGPDGELRWIIHRTEDVTAYVRDQQENNESDRAGTEQMETEVFARRTLHEENQTLTAVIDSLDAVVVGCDADGRPVLYNEAARRLLGDRLEGLPARQWPQRLHLHNLDGALMRSDEQPLVRVLRGERVQDAEMVVRPPGGPRQVFRVNGRPVTGRPGLAAVIAMHDVTVHRRAARLTECELQVSEIIARHAPADEVLHEAIRLIGSMTGWSATEFWTVDDVAPVLRRATCWAEPDRQLPCELADPLLLLGQGLPGKAWQTTEPVWATDLHTDPDAARQTDDWGPLRAAIAVPIPSGTAVLGVLVCYSDTSEIPDDVRTGVLAGICAHIGEFLERRRAERLTAELDRTHDEYIALVGHELRTPLTSMQAYAEMMLDEPGLTPDHRDMLQVVQRNTAKLHIIIAKLLDVAGLRSGNVPLHIRSTDLVPVIRAAVAAARDTVTTPITIEVNAPATMPVDGDPDRLRDVVDELLNNALTWATDHTTVGVHLHADARVTVLTVSDTGARIPDEERARVFDLFFRTDATRHQGLPGTGIGLTLARAVIEQHGGTITVSEPDEAVTAFTVRLPTRHPTPPERERRPLAVPAVR